MYLFSFYARGAYAGADSFRCRSEAHALRLAAYVALAFAREATGDFSLARRDVKFYVSAPGGARVGANAGAATVAL